QSPERFRPGSFGNSNAMMGLPRRGLQASVTYSLSRQREGGVAVGPNSSMPDGGLPDDPFDDVSPIFTPSFGGDRSSIGLNASFSPTAFWTVSWNTQYNVTDGRFESHQLQLQRDLHDWRASFNFARNANG